MSIKINEVKTIEGKEIVTSFNMGMNLTDKQWDGAIIFTTFDKDGNFVSLRQQIIEKKDWNHFWDNFNDSTALYKVTDVNAKAEPDELVNK